MDPANNAWVVNEFLQTPGQKVICGGTTTTIVSRETGRTAEVERNTALRLPAYAPTCDEELI
jgi:hypothetical protein